MTDTDFVYAIKKAAARKWEEGKNGLICHDLLTNV